MRAFIDKYCRYLLSWPRGFCSDRRGVVVVLVALAMPILAGTMGLAAEASYWYVHKRAMQNAADAAVIAAATDGSSNYATTAQAVAAQYRFQNGAGNITVTASNPNTAAGCTANCYIVTISDKVPLFLSRVIGYSGDATVGGKGETAMAAASVATSYGSKGYCIIALAGSVTDITTNGGPKADLNGCNIMSNSGANCNGHNLGANEGDAHGTNNGCGIIQESNVPVIHDPYAYLAKNIPANPCGGSYPGTTWRANQNLSGNTIVCGNLQVSGDGQINAPSNAVLVIENGQLAIPTSGETLQTTSGSGLTIVFTGTNSSSYQYIPSGGGTLDIAAPTSGPWSGVALYQDPNLTDQTTNLDITYKGNNPTWNITGLVYLPHSNVTLNGIVSKASNGGSCFMLVVGDMTINGTGQIFANDTGCSAAGLAGAGLVRAQLVN
ncbi:MAG: pilus assembly protein TadG-related protein [Methylocella sp.]